MRLLLVFFMLVGLKVIRAASNNEDILFDFFSSNMESDNTEVQPSSGHNSSVGDQFETLGGSAALNGSTNTNYALNNLTSSEPNSILKTNFKLKKQKLFFGKKLLLWKRNTNRGYGAFLMLCEPDITCVTPQTKLAIANCMNSGGSALANQLYNSCSNQNRIQCTDQDVARRLLGCLRLQSANNVLITAQSRQCVRQVVTLGTLDCFVRILRAKPKYRMNIRYSTVQPDAAGGGAVTAAGMGEGNIEGVEDPDADAQNGVRRLEVDSSQSTNSSAARKGELELRPQKVENTHRLAKREINDDRVTVRRNHEAGLITRITSPPNENKSGTFQDPMQFVTLSYDEEPFGESNRTGTFLNDNYFSESAYSETMSEENDSFGESFNDVMDLKNNLTLSDGNEDDEFEEVDGDENEDENENLLTNNGTENRLQISLAFNDGPTVIRWSSKPANLENTKMHTTNKPSNFSNSFDLIKSINLISSLRNGANGKLVNGKPENGRPENGKPENGRPANGKPVNVNQSTNRPNNQFINSFHSYPAKSLPLRPPADFAAGAKQQVRSKRQCRHNRKPYNGKRRWQNGRDRSNRRTYPHQYNHFKDGGPDDDERKWEMIERKRSRV